jgi:hypothetical protein
LNNLRKYAIIASLPIIALGATVAIASSDLAPGCKQLVGIEQALSIEQLTNQLTVLGYANIQEIEREEGCFEVEALDSENREMELLVHAVTGEILKAEPDD